MPTRITGAGLLGAGLVAAAISTAAAAEPSLTPDAGANLTGVWSNASLTWLERPAHLTSPTLSEAEAEARAAADPFKRMAEADAAPINPNQALPEVDTVAASHSVIFLEPGASFAKVGGEYRTSWIVEPATGRLPLTELGKTRSREAAATSARMDPAGPEDLAPNDRCLLGSRGSGGPGMLNNYYNSNYQFIQTPSALAIVVEMNFGTRIIPIHATKAAAQSAHRPAVLGLWMGDSVAWWDQGALFIETTHVHPTQGRFGPIFLSPGGVVTERLKRTSDTEIFYEFRVEDPVYYTQPWRAEMVLTALNGQIYEYACHEGNYAMSGILAGARLKEAKDAAVQPALPR